MKIVRGMVALAICGIMAAGHASDVPYVPTPMNVVDAMLEMGGVGPDDFLVDLGSGDGRISIRAAQRYGTRGFGVDLDDQLVRSATEDAHRQGVSSKVQFEARNIFETDVSRATVVTAYLLSSVNHRLRPRLFEQLKPGARIVTHDFAFGEWAPDRKLTIDVPEKMYGPPRSDIMLWVVPANLAGVWQWTQTASGGNLRYEARIEQKFQNIVGTGGVDLARSRILEGRVNGTAVELRLGSGASAMHYSGVIEGDLIRGNAVMNGGAAQAWQARRVRSGKMNIGGFAETRVAAVGLDKEQ